MLKARSRAASFLLVGFLKTVLAVMRLVPALAPQLQAIASRQAFRQLSKDRKFSRITSLGELPNDAAFFVAHERESEIWLYPCETEREAGAYVAMARRRNEAAKVYRGIPTRLDPEQRWLYCPALVAPGQSITPRRHAWIGSMRAREAQKLRIRLHVPE